MVSDRGRGPAGEKKIRQNAEPHPLNKIAPLTDILLDVVAREPAGHFAERSLPPAAILALCQCDDVALLEAKLVIVGPLERVLRLHGKLARVHADDAARPPPSPGCRAVVWSKLETKGKEA